jgi:two-component system sensor histidine kinase SenX3
MTLWFFVAVGACMGLIGFAGAAMVRIRRAADRARRAERAAAAARQRASSSATDMAVRDAALSTLADGVVVFDPEGRVAYANSAAQTILSRRFDSISEVTPAALREAIVLAATASRPIELDVEISARRVQATALATSQGNIVLMSRDVTEQRQLDRVRRDFVASASHELKTPVASILALAETLKKAASDPEALDGFLDRLEQEAERLSGLVKDLLDLSRLEGDRLDDADVSLADVIRQESERLRPRAQASGIRLVVDSLDEAVVHGSSSDLALLMHNLLDNAIRYSPDGGEVRATLGVHNGTAELRIADTGIGIPSRDVDRIFERFYRGDPARSRETGGTGLGLAIVRHVAEAHGGSVAVRSVLGAGSTFIVRLPLSGAGHSEGSGPPAPEHALEARPR